MSTCDNQTYTFQLFANPRRFKRSTLEFSGEFISFDGTSLANEEVIWLKIAVHEMYINGAKTSTYYTVELADPVKKITLRMNDGFFGRSGKSIFDQLHPLVISRIGSRIINRMILTLQRGEFFTIGDAVFESAGVRIPERGIFIKREAAFIPWSDVSVSFRNGQVYLVSARDKRMFFRADPRKIENACLIGYLHHYLVEKGNYNRLQRV